MANITQMTKGILEGCIMQLLDNRFLYSQEIVAEIQNLGFGHVTDGTLFPLLLRLEQEKIFTIEMRSVPNGPKRKYYSLNQNGKLELQKFIETWNHLKSTVDKILQGGIENV